MILSVASFAQNNIAIVNTDAFYDEKSGITELVIANKKLEVEFKPIDNEIKPQLEKFNSLGKELSNDISFCSRIGHCNLEKLEKRMVDYEVQSKEFKLKLEALQLQYKKRKTEIVEPINERIAEKLEVFRKNKSYTMIVDVSKDNSSAIIENIETLPDITKEFIRFCNEEFEKEKKQNK